MFQFLDRVEEEDKNKADRDEDVPKPFVLHKDDGEVATANSGKDKNSGQVGSEDGGQGGDGSGLEDGLKLPISAEQLELQKKAKEYLEASGGEVGANPADGDATKNSRKRKRARGYNDDDEEIDSSEGGSSSDEEEAAAPPGSEGLEGTKGGSSKKEPAGVSGETDKKDDDGERKADDGSSAEDAKDKKVKDDSEVEKEAKDDAGEALVDSEGNAVAKPRPLHKVTSIFLRNLSPTITKQEVEAMCRRYPGFLRAAIADPQPERRWFRRGWVTFERDAKIKEICYNLNNIRLRDCELGPIVNRDLSRRIRTVNGITVDKKVVRNDIKLAAKVITNLDKRWQLWEPQPPKAGRRSEGDEAEDGGCEIKQSDPANGVQKQEQMMEGEDPQGLTSNNPILANITDYLIEEASAEEEELLGKNSELEDGEEGEEGNTVVRDAELISVLDRLLFYLRIVHSVDFYNTSEYPNEDEMPNRCGIMHARGIPPISNVTQVEVDDYLASFSKKMGSFLQPRSNLSEEEALKLGMKNETDEVEKFIQVRPISNIERDKLLC